MASIDALSAGQPRFPSTITGTGGISALEHFWVAGWNHVASQKCGENKKLECFRVSAKNGNALAFGSKASITDF
jgi:hypothetical protein